MLMEFGVEMSWTLQCNFQTVKVGGKKFAQYGPFFKNCKFVLKNEQKITLFQMLLNKMIKNENAHKFLQQHCKEILVGCLSNP